MFRACSTGRAPTTCSRSTATPARCWSIRRRPTSSACAARADIPACYHPQVTRRWIVDDLGEPAFEQLATRLSGSALQSVLLEVMQHRAAARSPADVLGQYARDPFCRPAEVDQRTSVAVDSHLLAAAAGFDEIGR